jgi:D-aminopeptidase
MKVLIWFDMEGISGIDDPNMCELRSPLLQKGRKLGTADVNAVIQGLKRGGATQISIFDGHDFGGNLIAEDLDPSANYLSGGCPKSSSDLDFIRIADRPAVFRRCWRLLHDIFLCEVD